VRRGSVANPGGRASGQAWLLGGGDGLGVDVAAVDAGLEAAADVLARREQRVVADAPGRELHDPHRLVPIPMTAGVGSRLIERPQAIVLPP